MACKTTCMRMPDGNNTLGHCGDCHHNFSGLAAFDAHFKRLEDGRVQCLDAEDSFKWDKYWVEDLNGHTVWHKGAKLTAEDKKRIWG